MSKREDVARNAEKFMSQRENIRNIGVVAHIDHGKCVSGKTNILLENGKIEKAEDLFKLSEKGKKAKENKNEIVFDISNLNEKVLSFDKNRKEITAKKITHVWKLKTNEKLIKLTFSNGSEIKTTLEHKFLLLNEKGKILEKQAKEIELNDFILAPKFIKTKPANLNELKQNILQNLAKDDGFFIRLNERNSLEIKRKILDYGLERTRKEIQSKLKNKSFYQGAYNGRYRLTDFKKICEKFGYDCFELIDSINYRESLKKDGHSSIDLKLPKTEYEFTEFSYLLGLIWGDGGKSGKEIRITNEDKQIIEETKSIAERVFGMKATERKYENKATRIDLRGGLTFLKILEKAFDLPLSKKSESIEIPKPIQSSSNQLLKAFIQGYFDADGTVETSRRAVSLNSKSIKILEQLKLSLLRFNCMATLNKKKQAIYISGTNLKIFSEEIGFRLKRKQEKALKFSAISQTNRNTDALPISGKILKEIRKELEIPLNAFKKTQEAIESGKQKIYSLNFKEFISTVYSFVGNPKIKNPEAWEKIQEIEKTLFDCSTLFVTKKEQEKEEYVFDFSVEDTHNFIGNGLIIHNTTMTDNLIAASGIISTELAGKQQFMDFYALEQERGITINAANVSIVQNYKGKDYLINIIDTPGHIDFGGEVIRAMRAVDGVILVVDAVEGVMPQTETVIRQSLKENVKPSLFINKVDRLVNELQLTEKQMQERFIKTIVQVNRLIERNAPDQFKEKWKVRVEDGSVVFGSAYYNWAVSVLHMKTTGITFKEVYNYCKNEDQKTLAEKSPLYEAIVELVIQHLPNPLVAQKYRIPKIWKGEIESIEGKAMIECDPNGPLSMMIVDVSVDPHAGDVATGRIYSGTVRKGTQIKMIGGKKDIGVQQVALFMGPERVAVSEVPAGNIAALVGLKEVYAGETLSTINMKEFEAFMSNTEPVITVSVEAKEAKNLPKLIEVIRQITKEDPNIRAVVNQDTGEHLLSGMGELHLEVTQHRIEVDHKIPITVSPPIVVYRETINKNSPKKHEAKTPNKHNKFYMHVEKIPEEIMEKLIESKINGKIREKDKHLVQQFIDMGIDREEAKRIWAVNNNCYIVNATKGIEALFEVRELITQAFNDATNEGPLAKEKVQGIKVMLEDAKLHEDAIHRGPAQVLPAITRGIYACILQADPLLFEPKQILFITVPQDFMGAVSKELGARRAQITDMKTEGDQTIIIGKAPVKELIGFSAAIRGATQGRAIWTAEYAGFELLPRELQHNTVVEIRKRKGMDPEPKKADFFFD